MSRAQETIAREQFGPRAAAYVESAVHAQGQDLDALEEIAQRTAPVRALDLGSGGGHAAYRLARHAGIVAATDLSPEMLQAIAASARARGLDNIETVEAPAEELPFDDAGFDMLACRFSAHHWRDMEAGLREARRVLKSGAPAIFIDAVSTGGPAEDTHLQSVELLRDASHVRDYSAAEWTAALARAGFQPQATRAFRLRMDFESWTARMRTPPELQRAIRALQAAASNDVRTHFAIGPDGSFMLDALMIEAV